MTHKAANILIGQDMLAKICSCACLQFGLGFERWVEGFAVIAGRMDYVSDVGRGCLLVREGKSAM